MQDRPRPEWRQVLLSRHMPVAIILGTCLGIPLYLFLQMVPAWMRDQGASLTVIGIVSLATIPQSLNFLWAPFLDRHEPRLFGRSLGRSRGWLLLLQIGVFVGIGTLGQFDPATDVLSVGILAFLTMIFTASMQVVSSSYLRRAVDDLALPMAVTLLTQAVRVAGLIPGGLALILADHLPWSSVFWIVAGFMLVGIGLTLLIREPEAPRAAPASLVKTVVEPYRELIGRLGPVALLTVVGFLLFYKLGDALASALAQPFYIDLGFSLTEIGLVVKNTSLVAIVAGGVSGGLVMLRLGVARSLWIFGVLQMMTTLGFVALASTGPSLGLLAVVIFFDYFAAGLGQSAQSAFVYHQTNRAYAGTQIALLNAATLVVRSIGVAAGGVVADATGWLAFFWICTVLAVPGLLLLPRVAPWRGLPPAIPALAVSRPALD